MKFHSTSLEGAKLIELQRHGDERGFFARTMCTKEFAAEGLATEFVQINMSHSAFKGTLRGMHFQRNPWSEAKLMRCTRGAIWDCIVDLRKDSPTYLKHQGFELTAENRLQLYCPPGFAHGFVTLVDDVEVTYPVSNPYTPQAEGGVRYDDPLLAIEWPVEVVHVSDKDVAWPLLDRAADPIF
jgi:dTDP-4-dehydrorhamnose 3,5-epimerase